MGGAHDTWNEEWPEIERGSEGGKAGGRREDTFGKKGKREAGREGWSEGHQQGQGSTAADKNNGMRETADRTGREKSGGASEKRKRKRKRGRVRKRETRTETLQFAELLAE